MAEPSNEESTQIGTDDAFAPSPSSKIRDASKSMLRDSDEMAAPASVRAVSWNQTGKNTGAIRTKLGVRPPGLRTSLTKSSETPKAMKEGAVEGKALKSKSATPLPSSAKRKSQLTMDGFTQIATNMASSTISADMPQHTPDVNLAPSPHIYQKPPRSIKEEAVGHMATTLRGDDNRPKIDLDDATNVSAKAQQTAQNNVTISTNAPGSAHAEGTVFVVLGSDPPPNDKNIEHDTGHESSSNQSSDIEDDRGVMLNVLNDSSGLESGEISDSDGDAEMTGDLNMDLDGDEDSQSDSESGSDESEDLSDWEEEEARRYNLKDSKSAPHIVKTESDEEYDPMHTYADSHATGKHLSSTTSTVHQLTLNDLSPAELKLQLRYFHALRDPSGIPASDPAHCLVCASPAHSSDSCPTTTCRTCSSTSHFSWACPRNTYCSRCRKPGHGYKSCPSQLAAGAENIPCAHCGRLGHVEMRCETLWRTSGYPWTKDVPTDGSVHLSCYECGHQGHLGNDCPTRRPGKPMGSSTWSAKAWSKPHRTAGRESGVLGQKPKEAGIGPKPKSNYGGRGKTGHKIPNKNLRMEESSGDDGLNTIVAKGTGPRGMAPRGPNMDTGPGGLTRSGQGIRIAGIASAPNGPRLAGGDGRIENMGRDYRAGPAYGNGPGDYQPRGPGPQGGGYDRPAYDRGGYDRGGYERRRSRSPPRRSGGNGDRYVPLPSAGRDAWRRGRL